MTESMAPIAGYSVYDPVDPFENRAGPFYWRQDDAGRHHFALRAEERHCNSHGIVHGGLMMTLIDLTMVVTAKQFDGEQLVTVSLNTEFTASARTGDIIHASGEVVRRGRTLAFVRGTLSANDRVLLSASAVLMPIVVRGSNSEDGAHA